MKAEHIKTAQALITAVDFERRKAIASATMTKVRVDCASEVADIDFSHVATGSRLHRLRTCLRLVLGRYHQLENRDRLDSLANLGVDVRDQNMPSPEEVTRERAALVLDTFAFAADTRICHELALPALMAELCEVARLMGLNVQGMLSELALAHVQAELRDDQADSFAKLADLIQGSRVDIAAVASQAFAQGREQGVLDATRLPEPETGISYDPTARLAGDAIDWGDPEPVILKGVGTQPDPRAAALVSEVAELTDGLSADDLDDLERSVERDRAAKLPGEVYAADRDPKADPRAQEIMGRLRQAATSAELDRQLEEDRKDHGGRW